MVFIRIFKILFITAVNPINGFHLYLNDPKEKLTRRLAYWLTFIGMMTTYYFMVHAQTEVFNDPPFLAWLTFVMLKFFGIIMFFFAYGITGVIMGFDNVQTNPIAFITAIYAFTIIPEFIFLLSIYYYPEFYQEIRFLCHVWRIVLIIFGTYVMAENTMKQAIIIGVVAGIILYFFNYNYFAEII